MRHSKSEIGKFYASLFGKRITIWVDPSIPDGIVYLMRSDHPLFDTLEYQFALTKLIRQAKRNAPHKKTGLTGQNRNKKANKVAQTIDKTQKV